MRVWCSWTCLIGTPVCSGHVIHGTATIVTIVIAAHRGTHCGVAVCRCQGVRPNLYIVTSTTVCSDGIGSVGGSGASSSGWQLRWWAIVVVTVITIGHGLKRIVVIGTAQHVRLLAVPILIRPSMVHCGVTRLAHAVDGGVAVVVNIGGRSKPV
jgi:hypothetical protein